MSFSSLLQASTQPLKVCPGKGTVYNINQEGTLKVYIPKPYNITLTAKILPEGAENKIFNALSYGSGFEILNPSIKKYKVSTEAISSMKTTLDLASSMMRAVTIYYDDTIIINISNGETGYQMWGITGPQSKADSASCIQ